MNRNEIDELVLKLRQLIYKMNNKICNQGANENWFTDLKTDIKEIINTLENSYIDSISLIKEALEEEKNTPPAVRFDNLVKSGMINPDGTLKRDPE